VTAGIRANRVANARTGNRAGPVVGGDTDGRSIGIVRAREVECLIVPGSPDPDHVDALGDIERMAAPVNRMLKNPW
jgi:hypothetical protein